MPTKENRPVVAEAQLLQATRVRVRPERAMLMDAPDQRRGKVKSKGQAGALPRTVSITILVRDLQRPGPARTEDDPAVSDPTLPR